MHERTGFESPSANSYQSIVWIIDRLTEICIKKKDEINWDGGGRLNEVGGGGE